MTGTGIGIAGLDGGQVALSADQVAALDTQIGGALLRPDDDGFDDAVEIWNAMVATTPALVVQPASSGDVATAVVFARTHGLLLTVKGGGHNIAGTSMAEGGLTLDMSRLRDVEVDPAARLARVGPGCRLKHVDGATQEHGLATVLGFVSETGVAGLTLGGGFGYLTRRFGWAVDNLVEVEIVTADGQVRSASRDHDPDLFWAVRGGGGNFGVVTRFTFRLHEVGPTITGGLVGWGADEADDVLAAYRDLTTAAPRGLTAAVVALLAPPAPFVPEEWHGKPVVGLLVCHSGDDPDADLDVLGSLGEPVVDLVGEKPYTVQQSLLDDLEPNGLHQYWKAEFLPGLEDGYLPVFRDAALAVTSPQSYPVIFHLGGALNERADDDGAVGNRDARFISGFSGVWTPDDPRADEHTAWVRRGWEAIRPFSTGGNYVNFQLADDADDRTADAYGGNYRRLREIKGRYDPHNLFRVNRNIPPGR